MQFSIISLVAALAATASAQYAVNNGTQTSAALYPTGTGSARPSGSAASPSGPKTSSTAPFEGGAASNMAGSAMGLVIAGGVALML